MARKATRATADTAVAAPPANAGKLTDDSKLLQSLLPPPLPEPKKAAAEPLKAFDGLKAAIYDDKPEEMSREDQRVIFAKLNDTYLSEDKGYAEHWTDKKVAADLGVPRIWVERVREQFFGPIKVNEDTLQFREEWSKISGEVKIIEQKHAKLLDDMRQMEADMRDLLLKHERATKRLSEIERMVIP